MRILIATPCFHSEIFADYAGSLLNTLKYCAAQSLEAELYFLKGSSSIGSARNTCASYAMRGAFDKLFFIDADQVWSPEQAGLLLSSKRTLVGGTYCKKEHPLRLNFNPLPEHGAKYGKLQVPENYGKWAQQEADESGEVEVRHIPTGFMLIDCSVLHALKEGCPTYLSPDTPGEEDVRHYDFFPSGVLQGRYETEDWFFCSIAKEAGHAPYLQTKVIVDHLGLYNYRLERAFTRKDNPK